MVSLSSLWAVRLIKIFTLCPSNSEKQKANAAIKRKVNV